MSLNTAFASELDARIEQLKADKVYKRLNHLDSPQSARVQMEGRGEVLILSSNNYLGLCDEPERGRGGHRRASALRRGHGERPLHLRHVHDPSRARGSDREVRRHASRRSRSCAAWNANEALTATIVEEGDFVVSDALNHASIIDSMRLAKAIAKCTTAVYKHGDMDDLVSSSSRRRARSVASSGPTASSRWKARSRSCPTSSTLRARYDADRRGRRLARDRRARRNRTRHRRAFRRARRGGHHHVDAGQGARRRGGRVRRGIRRRCATC